MIFRYPEYRNQRRHGPEGYENYGSYRPWLRDEFDFRCVYCLKRESLGSLTGEFELDHFHPQWIRPDLSINYHNLVYACARCNAVKGIKSIPDPFRVLVSNRMIVRQDGIVVPNDLQASYLIDILDLNCPRLVDWRILWMRILELANQHDEHLRKKILGYPDRLEDLSKLKPPFNSLPDGIRQSCFARRQRGELQEAY